MIKKIIVFFIRLYQAAISPLFPPTCRFYPSCSEYTIQAFQKHTFFRAILLTVWRVLRCNPLVKGGYDPVEEIKLRRS